MTLTKALMLTAFIGHLICWRCDWIITCTPNGRFSFKCFNDNEKMSGVFENMPLKNPLISMLLGVLSMMMSFCGYIGLYEWMKQFSVVYAVIIIASSVLFYLPGVAHHVFCGVIEWFYIRLGRTEDAHKAVVEFFKKNIVNNACVLYRVGGFCRGIFYCGGNGADLASAMVLRI